VPESGWRGGRAVTTATDEAEAVCTDDTEGVGIDEGEDAGEAIGAGAGTKAGQSGTGADGGGLEKEAESAL